MRTYSAAESRYATEKRSLPIAGMFPLETSSWLEIAQLQVARKQYEAEPEIKTVDIAVKLTEIENEIQESKYILDLADNWDDEGSKGYSESTWNRVTNFLRELSHKAFMSFHVTIDSPKIYHGINGSIDMRWNTDQYHLLVNFPESESSPASFYYNTKNKDTAKGVFYQSNGGCNVLMLLVGAKQCTTPLKEL